ncbi:major royal jelly family protein [Novosphingobium kaempferiae]|uniref:major royal jelly family protein n=1 Tax=Novosphingobium kaempferiae TaxID=2896849 RepID=UPI001E619C41|nr:major royal jelly family protein [Novosphingobium kaempferiae]
MKARASLLAVALVLAGGLARGGSALADAPAPTAGRLEVVRQLDGFSLIGVAVTPAGRIFASAPAATSGDKVIEIDPRTGAITPFPAAGWQVSGQDTRHCWFAPQALWVDDAGALWVLDSGRPTLPSPAPTGPAKLVKFDLAGNRVERTYDFEGAVDAGDSLNDLRIDNRRGLAYLTNIDREGSLVVLDLKTGEARQVLIADRSTRADPAEHLHIGGKVGLLRSGKPPLVHADGIEMSPDGQWVYYRTLTDHNYWRVPAAALADAALPAAKLAASVVFLGKGPITGGIIMTPEGTLYGGDLEHGGIVGLRFTGRTLASHVVPQTEAIAWGDGFSVAGGYLYIADARLSEKVFANSLPKRGVATIYRIRLTDLK